MSQFACPEQHDNAINPGNKCLFQQLWHFNIDKHNKFHHHVS